MEPVRGAMERLLTNGGDKIRDGRIVDRLGVDAPAARITRKAREAEVRPSAREARKQLAPGRSQGLLAPWPDRHQAARLHGRKEVGPDVGKALRRHAGGHRVDGGQAGADRREVECDTTGNIPKQVSDPDHCRTQVAQPRR
jgi:hypothetical protein